MSVVNRSKLPTQIDEPDDPKKGTFQGDKYDAERTRSGHLIATSDVPNQEMMIWQHRCGQYMCFRPDGSIQFRANKGMHTFVLGQSHHYISGLESKTTGGDKGERILGDSYISNEKNSTHITKGNSVTSSKNEAKTVAEQSDTVMGSGTVQAKSGYNVKVTHGALALNATKGASLGSSEESVAIVGAIAATVEGGKSVALTAAQDLHIKVGSFEIFIDSSGVWINSNRAKPASEVFKSKPADKAANEGDFGAQTEAVGATAEGDSGAQAAATS